MLKQYNNGRNRIKNGFTVIELLITLFVVAAAFLLISTTYSMVARMTDKSEDFLSANSIAYQKLQRYENDEFTNIPSGPVDAPYEVDFGAELPSSLSGPTEAKVFITDQTPTLKYIFVRLTYHSTGIKQTLEYGSYVQQGGLGR